MFILSKACLGRTVKKKYTKIETMYTYEDVEKMY